jgi:hypothetical protein
MTVYEQEKPKGTTEYYVILTTGNQLKEFVDWPTVPTRKMIKDLVEPLIQGRLERIAVWHHGGMRDMFIDADCVVRAKPRNEVATEIYRCYHLTRYPKTKAESLAYVMGDAVLFGRRVWS